MVKHWHAGSYKVGYQPLTPFGGVYRTEAIARAALVMAFDDAWFQGRDADFLEGHTQLHNGEMIARGGDRYYEVYECGNGACRLV